VASLLNRLFSVATHSSVNGVSAAPRLVSELLAVVDSGREWKHTMPVPGSLAHRQGRTVHQPGGELGVMCTCECCM
jgi:hypothetical protein